MNLLCTVQQNSHLICISVGWLNPAVWWILHCRLTDFLYAFRVQWFFNKIKKPTVSMQWSDVSSCSPGAMSWFQFHDCYLVWEMFGSIQPPASIQDNVWIFLRDCENIPCFALLPNVRVFAYMMCTRSWQTTHVPSLVSALPRWAYSVFQILRVVLLILSLACWGLLGATAGHRGILLLRWSSKRSVAQFEPRQVNWNCCRALYILI